MSGKWKLLFGFIGTIVAKALKLDPALQVLLVIMAVDYVTGVMVAAVFKKSPKTETGALSSAVGWRGLCRKGMILLYVVIGLCIDYLMQINYVMNAVCYCYIANDLLSITENAGLMGLPIPPIITSMIDVLRRKEKTEDKTEEDKNNA